MMRLLPLLGFTLLLLTGCPTTGVVCNPGTSACGAGCADFTSDRRNCGMCGGACLEGQICTNSTCLCEIGSVLCNGACVALENDPRNCGHCGSACNTGEVCEAKTCKATCSIGFTQCGQSCVMLNDTQNCGRCGNTCAQAQTCRNGTCAWDFLAACFTNGEVSAVSVAPGNRSLSPIGSHPASLASYSTALLVLDGTDARLNQLKLSDLSVLNAFNQTGRGPTEVVVDGTRVYSVNSNDGTLQVLGPPDDAGCPAPLVPDAGCAFVALDDGGAGEPLEADGGCFTPRFSDGGCVDTLLDDGGTGPYVFSDGGCFSAPVPQTTFNFCAQGDAGVLLQTLGEINFGVNTFPEAAVKANGTLWVPLHGGVGVSSAAGQKVVEVNVDNPRNPTLGRTVDFTHADLHLFDAGTTDVAGPFAIATMNGQLYVALNNLNPFVLPEYPGGSGLLGVIDPVTLDAGVVDLGADRCQNVVYVAAATGVVYVSCAGAAVFDSNNVVTGNAHSGVVAYVPGTGVTASWAPPACGADDAGCPPTLPGRLAVSGSTVYVADQSGGRVYVLDASDGGLTQVGSPIAACPYDSVTGFSNVADILTLP